MATNFTIRGVPVSFPCEPYALQKDYMEKVIDCLQSESNGVLESPTGTGKTLALLCSSLAWLTIKKAQIKAQFQTAAIEEANEYMQSLQTDLGSKAGPAAKGGHAFFRLPTVIYASRTHSQLSQAMQELKRTAYSHMKASVLGSREQLCIHPDIMKEENSGTKIQLCRLKLQLHACHFYNRVEKKKEDPAVTNASVLDIEDLVKLGQVHKFCPYYMAKELKQQADIVFMPYNYLLDPRIRKTLGVELINNVVILDEAHNIERICEDSASMQIKSTDIALCIDEITEVMKSLTEEVSNFFNNDVPKDITPDELCVIKEMLLNLEKALDEIELNSGPEGTTFEGTYIFKILEKANIRDENSFMVTDLLDKIVQFLSTTRDGPFQRKGNSSQLLGDLLRIAFASPSPAFKEKINQCYKVHIVVEEQKTKGGDNWLSKATSKSKQCRVLSYWCFSPGFGMNMLMNQGLKCVILTSGTLAPLQPLISELELKVDVRLENPHVVTSKQVCVKILGSGPDGEMLNCSYQNRDNPRYVASLGRAILNVTRMIPGGLLIFFPSYPILKKCQEQWQHQGIWSDLHSLKPIFVEPKFKEAFTSAMNEYYSKINESASKGAIFMGVCRGKVSEGLDFADMNGRAVIVIGLPYPPLRDPRVILKKRYLDICNARNKEYLRGDDWYSLEASRAVNQAIGRVIRHQHDYGAIILMDSRFNNPRIKAQMSMWLRDRIEVISKFGVILRQLKMFFQNAEATLPTPTVKQPKKADEPRSDIPSPLAPGFSSHKQNLYDFSTGYSPQALQSDVGLVNIHKRNPTDAIQNKPKKKKIVLVTDPAAQTSTSQTPAPSLEASAKQYIVMVKEALNATDFQRFVSAIYAYRDESDFDELAKCIDRIFLSKHNLRYIIQGLEPYIKALHKDKFQLYWQNMRS